MLTASKTPASTNHHGVPAYELPPRMALAHLACTGTLSPVFYADAAAQYASLLMRAWRVDADYLAKTALYARERGFMKATPALLCAALARRDGALLDRIFDRVLDNGRMLRNFVDHMRSGIVGSRGLSARPRRLVQRWFDRRSDAAILRASVGNDPSLADVIRLAHVKPNTPARAALFAYLLGRPFDEAALPPIVQALRAFQRGERDDPPAGVPFQLLTADSPGPDVWRAIARSARWQMTRMNLNTFARHGVFDDPEMAPLIARRLARRSEVLGARAFPYQLMTTLHNSKPGVPERVRAAVERALEISLERAPAFDGKLYICVDISGSMGQPVTGGGKTRCVDVAALLAAVFLRKNPEAELILFNHEARSFAPLRAAPVSQISRAITSRWGGGTDCSAPLQRLNRARKRGELILMISDQESWVDAQRVRLPQARRSSGPRRTSLYGGWGDPTELIRQWRLFRQRSPAARMICLDLAPYHTVMAPPEDDILHVGGFSDAVFSVIDRYARGALAPGQMAAEIDAVQI